MMTTSHRSGKTKSKTKKNKKKLSPEEKRRRRAVQSHIASIRSTFVRCGFEHFKTRNQEVEIAGRIGEFDSAFIFENILVFVEDTSLKSDIDDHLRKKVEFFRHVRESQDELFEELRSKVSGFRGYFQRTDHFEAEEFKLIFVYSSLNPLELRHKSRYIKDVVFLDYAHLLYFVNLSRTINYSAKFELFNFLRLELKDIGAISSATHTRSYKGLLLPKVPSGFPKDHALVSFMVDPEMLLQQVYVLRADSWQDSDCLYQRLLVKNKIVDMRNYLSREGRVYVNNIIVTLPSDTEIKDSGGRRVVVRDFKEIKPIMIDIPKRFGTIGIIDGQHRVFSYHEGNDNAEREIKKLRKKQHLLVTGIVYPENMTLHKKQKFEAKLFLEINDKQKRVKGDLKQAILMIIHPTSSVAIAKAVIGKLAIEGPLSGRLETHFYDRGKIKTTSIVSYGLRHVVALGGDHSLFSSWSGSGKTRIRNDSIVLESYIQYCSKQINSLIVGFKFAVPNKMWTSDNKLNRVLTTTTINGLIFCLRLLIENDNLEDQEGYTKKFSKLKINFAPEKFQYKSSHWKALGEAIYNQCFKT